MSEILTADIGIFKAIGALSISATAKYIGTIMRTLGTSSVSEICAVTGLPRSTVYRAQSEFFEHAGQSLSCLTRPTSENLTCLTHETETEKPVSVVPPVRQISLDASRAPASITTRATKELPSEVTYYEEVVITPLTPQAENKPAKSKRGTRLPDDWEMPGDWLDWVAVNCPASSPQRIATEALMFANFWQSKPGSQACKLDWFKTWKNWALKAFSTAPVRPGGSAYPSSNAFTAKQEAGRKALEAIDRRIAEYAQ